jgi:hypothetical protein
MTTQTHIIRATVGTVKGWAVKWGQARRRFRQVIWFPSREQADLFAGGLQAGDEGGDVERLLLKAWGRPRSITASERGRLGGPARAASLSKKRRLEISRKASAARWAHLRTDDRQIDAKPIDGSE